ncbi:polysaccharide biosynthesis protein [Bdellovibrio sp. HCB337]|uniref:polysaccharide biosynthesis protein n=1 Tax=Bdellovibrio sp. HCB337 TaxID=3394358 RepID=UPI0039A5C18A
MEFDNKVLLITGGTGSFGGAVLRRFLNHNLKEIRIFSRDEKKQEDMRQFYRNDRLKFYIGDVRDRQSIDAAMKGVDYVFHAAALKQVPSCEFHPLQAVNTNILGTSNVLNSAIDCNVKKVICLSTDKAVYPINAMGMSKALMEKTYIAASKFASESGTIICGTRYGNVMASRGSVIPLFIEQIMAGKPITITDPSMTRFMMSLDQAVDLVLFAFKHGDSGDMFVQKSPAATILKLAEAIKKSLNKESHPIKVIGTRHGEKLYETLLTREEMVRAIDLKDYYRIRPDSRDLNYNIYLDDGEEVITQASEYNSHNTEQLDVDELVRIVMGLEETKQYYKR